MSGTIIRREDYKKVKKMTREELDDLLKRYYYAGYNQGSQDMSNMTTMCIDEGLRNTPGIGEKRYNEILLNIRKAIDGVTELPENTAEK